MVAGNLSRNTNVVKKNQTQPRANVCLCLVIFPYICNVKRMLLAKYAFQLIRLYFVTDWILIEYISFQD